jgi:uncharacterized protein
VVPFEYDPKKSRANEAKHGIDFDSAQALWDDVDAVEFSTPKNDEERYALVARDENGKYWTAIFTHRSGNIRIISVRHARQDELKFYEDKSSENR